MWDKTSPPAVTQALFASPDRLPFPHSDPRGQYFQFFPVLATSPASLLFLDSESQNGNAPSVSLGSPGSALWVPSVGKTGRWMASVVVCCCVSQICMLLVRKHQTPERYGEYCERQTSTILWSVTNEQRHRRDSKEGQFVSSSSCPAPNVYQFSTTTFPKRPEPLSEPGSSRTTTDQAPTEKIGNNQQGKHEGNICCDTSLVPCPGPPFPVTPHVCSSNGVEGYTASKTTSGTIDTLAFPLTRHVSEQLAGAAHGCAFPNPRSYMHTVSDTRGRIPV